MIETNTDAKLGNLLRRLRQKGARLAKARARNLSGRADQSRHLWRDAARLWPDIFED